MNIRKIRTLCIHVVGWCFIGIVFYVCACLLLFVFAINLPKPVKIFPLFRYQRIYYYKGGRNIWQFDGQCAQPDKDLIYKPREGVCHFSNLEFDTTLHFDTKGRFVPAREHVDQNQPGIAVLGDSYGMGWGVEDAETFANVMQERLQKPVYNLSVSSYGTERELKRLALSGLADRIDTLFILYCENDLDENRLLQTPEDYAEAVNSWARQVKAGEGLTSYEDKLEFLGEVADEVLLAPALAPFQRLSSLVVQASSEGLAPQAPARDFTPHLEVLHKVLKRYESLIAGKKVYIAYITQGGVRLSNFRSGPDTVFPNVIFIEPSLSTDDFYLIDDHMKAIGHQHFGVWLASVLSAGNE